MVLITINYIKSLLIILIIYNHLEFINSFYDETRKRLWEILNKVWNNKNILFIYKILILFIYYSRNVDY
jgi:hypothetical protein